MHTCSAGTLRRKYAATASFNLFAQTHTHTCGLILLPLAVACSWPFYFVSGPFSHCFSSPRRLWISFVTLVRRLDTRTVCGLHAGQQLYAYTVIQLLRSHPRNKISSKPSIVWKINEWLCTGEYECVSVFKPYVLGGRFECPVLFRKAERRP